MNKTKLFFSSVFLFVSLFFVQSDLYSQLPCTIWSKLYNGPANQQDSAVAMSINGSGAVFVTGWSLGSGTGADIVVIRYNPATGDTLWVARYNNTVANVEDKPTSITSDNNAVYITGWSFGLANNRDVITLKLNAATGAIQFANRYNGPGNGGDYGYSVAVDAAGNVYSAGRTDNGGAQKYLVLKYDASGNTVAQFPFIYTGASSTTFDEAHSVKVDGSGNIYLTGRSGLIANGTDYMTMKVNSSAVDQWVKKHNGTQNAEDNALVLLLDATATNVYVGGYSFRTGQQQDYLTIRYNGSNGDSTAAAVYTGPAGSTDVLTAAAIDNAGNVFVTGASSAVGTALDFATIKYNSSLSQQWLARTTGPTNEQPTDLSVDNAGLVYVTGSILSGNYDYLTLAYFNDGSLYWQKTETGTGNANDFASFVVASDSTSVFVTGSANFSTTGIAMYTLRYTACTGIEPISSNVPSSFALMQNYPNPFNPATTIRFDIAKSSFVKIMVYDVTGRELEVLAAENLRAGEYEVKWDAAKYSSGVYFYSIIADNFVQTKKMILTK